MSFIEIEYRETNKEWNMADLQAHNFYEIYYLLKGERDIFIEDKIFTLHENSIVIIPPFYMHKTEGGPYQRINVYLSEDLLEGNERKFLSACSSILSFELEPAKRDIVLSLFHPFIGEEDKDNILKKKYSSHIHKLTFQLVVTEIYIIIFMFLTDYKLDWFFPWM